MPIDAFDTEEITLVGANTLTRERWLAESKLRLTTPTAIAYGLRLLGVEWRVGSAARGHSTEPGLYTWVDGGDGDALHAPVLYIGKAAGAAGLHRRLEDEQTWVNDGGYVHGHARAMTRRNARVVGGAVALVSEEAQSFADVERPFMNVKPSPAKALEWWSVNQTDTLACAEQLAIRLAIHLGDTGAPVNSQFAGAWNTSAIKAGCIDMLAMLVHARMLAELEGR